MPKLCIMFNNAGQARRLKIRARLVLNTRTARSDRGPGEQPAGTQGQPDGLAGPEERHEMLAFGPHSTVPEGFGALPWPLRSCRDFNEHHRVMFKIVGRQRLWL
jgi:hypothetical protein